MKVWYCKVHGIADIAEPSPKFCWLSLAQHAHFPCDFVEKLLVAEDALADVAWQFNEAVSLLREVRGSVMVPADVHEIDEGLPAMQAALEYIAVLAAAQVGEPG